MEVANFYGYSIGIGMIVSAITQLIKIAETVPLIGNLAPVKFVLDTIAQGNIKEIRIAVAILCVAMNLVSFFVNGGAVADSYQFITMAIGSFSSFITALGTFNLVFQSAETTTK